MDSVKVVSTERERKGKYKKRWKNISAKEKGRSEQDEGKNGYIRSFSRYVLWTIYIRGKKQGKFDMMNDMMINEDTLKHSWNGYRQG